MDQREFTADVIPHPCSTGLEREVLDPGIPPGSLPPLCRQENALTYQSRGDRRLLPYLNRDEIMVQ